MSRLCGLVLVTAALAPLSAPAQPDEVGDTFYLRAGRIYTASPGDGRVLERGVLFVQDGKIAAVLEADATLIPGIPVVDQRRAVLIPGLVACQLSSGSGRRDDSTLGARFQAQDGFDLYADHHGLLSQGITSGFLHPGRGRLATGRGAVVKLAGPPAKRLLVGTSDMCVELGEAALHPPPVVDIPLPSSSDVPIEPGEAQGPGSRLSLVAELRAQLKAALEYEDARGRLPLGERPELDLDLASLAQALLAGRLRIDARRLPELRGALELAQDLEIKPVLSGGAEINSLLAQVKELGLPVIYEMPYQLRSEPLARRGHPDRVRWSSETPRLLAKAQIPFALTPPLGSTADLRLLAAFSVRSGLSRQQALGAITSQAADLLGVGDRVGQLAPGLDADFVLLSDEPLATRSQVLETWVGGQRVYRSPGTLAVVVRAGTVHTLAGEPLTNGEILLKDGVIAAVGSSVPHPVGATVIDAGPEGVVTPGFVDAYGHLGLMGDKTALKAQTPLHGLIGRENAASLSVCRAGVTTVLMTPWALDPAGSRVVAIKTAEGRQKDLRRGMVVRETAGLAFDLSRMDPLIAPPSLLGRLKAGEAYHQKWQKYAEELERWHEQQKKGEKPPAPAKEEAAEEAQGDGWEDPISGTWSFSLSGPPLREPQEGTLKLKLEADRTTISGQAESPRSPEPVAMTGTLDGKQVELTHDVETPMGNPRTSATLDAEDHMQGTTSIGPFNIQFEADRTAREVPEIQVKARKKTRGGRPVPPPLDPGLEPLRAAYEGKAVLVLRVTHPAAAHTLLKALEPSKLKVVFVGLTQGAALAEALNKAEFGVAIRPEGLERQGEGWIPPAAELARAGVRFGFMSEAEDGAQELPLRAIAAVQRGLGAGQALAALTIGAAKLYGLEKRVGSLEVGKDGDLLIFDGPPLEATSRLRTVIVGGRIVEEQ